MRFTERFGAARCAIAAALVVMAGVQSALAQSATAEAQAAGGLEVVVVTAQKSQENINDVGMMITALSGEDLARIGVATPDDLAKAVPGLYYNVSPNGAPIYTLRGVGFFDNTVGAPPAVALYLDEMPFPFPAMARGLAKDVQRVEVLKGPQGTLFGQNATGGAVNFIANRPTRSFEAGADVAFSSYDKIDGNAYVSGPITDSVRARLSVGGSYGGDWQQSYTRDDNNGTARFVAGRFLLDWDASERLALKFNLSGWGDNSDELAGQLVGLISGAAANPQLLASFNQYPATPPNARYADWAPGRPPLGGDDSQLGVSLSGFRRDADFLQAGMRADYSAGDTTFTSITSWARLRQIDFSDGTGLNVPGYDTLVIGDIDAISQELRAAGTLGKLSWILGGNFSQEKLANRVKIFTPIAAFPFLSSGAWSDEKFDTYAAFANLNYSVTDRLSLLAGIRYTDVKINNVTCTFDGGDGTLAGLISYVVHLLGQTYTIPPGGCTNLDPATFAFPVPWRDHLYESNLPFKLGANWKATPDTLLYASVNRGYKAGTYSVTGGVLNTSTLPARQEKVTNYEIGFKQTLDDGRLQLNGAVFRNDYIDKQVRGKTVVPIFGLIQEAVNIPKSRIVGAEADLVWAPNRNWRFGLSGSYLNSKVLDHYTNYSFGGVVMDMNGQRLPLTPEWSATADADYRTSLTGRFDGFIGAHLQYQGKTYSGMGQESLYSMDAYTTVDLRLGVQAPDERWSVTAFVNNLTDKYSWNFQSAPGPDTIIRYANLPRIVGVRFAVKR